MEFSIPCDTFARFASVMHYMPSDAAEWFRSVRYDSGTLVASNRTIIVAEHIGGPSGVFHIPFNDVLIEQARIERQFSGSFICQFFEPLNFLSIKSTVGWQYPGNGMLQSPSPNEMDKWRSIMPDALPKKSRGGMFWFIENVRLLADTSPSGRLVFQEHIDVDHILVIRDFAEANWCALYSPRRAENEPFQPANIPSWWIK